MSMESWSTKPRRRKPPDVFTHLLTRPPSGISILYYCGLYGARAGLVDDALKHLHKAIIIAPSYLSVAVSDEDWGEVLEAVRDATAEWSKTEHEEATRNLERFRKKRTGATLTIQTRHQLSHIVINSVKKLKQPAYTSAIEVKQSCLWGIKLIDKEIDKEKDLAELKNKLERAENERVAVRAQKEQLTQEHRQLVEKQRQAERMSLGGIIIALGLLIYFVWGWLNSSVAYLGHVGWLVLGVPVLIGVIATLVRLFRVVDPVGKRMRPAIEENRRQFYESKGQLGSLNRRVSDLRLELSRKQP